MGAHADAPLEGVTTGGAGAGGLHQPLSGLLKPDFFTTGDSMLRPPGSYLTSALRRPFTGGLTLLVQARTSERARRGIHHKQLTRERLFGEYFMDLSDRLSGFLFFHPEWEQLC